MRILVANEALSGAGGVETYLAAVTAGLQARGHVVGVLHDNPASERGAVRIVGDTTWRASVQDEGLQTAIDRVHHFQPDVCFSHNMRTLDIDATLLRHWPVVKLMHGHFGTCVSGHKAFDFPSACACTRPFGVGCLVHYLPRRCGHRDPVAMVKQYRWALRQRSLTDRYAALVVASRFMRDEYVREGADAGRVHVLPLFAPHQPASMVPGRTSRSVDVAFLGRMTSLKGPEVLLRACARAGRELARRLYIVMAGEGPERERLQALAATLDLDVSFPGWVDPAERDALLGRATLVSLPSIWPEPFGLVGLEAAVFGTPAVAFDSGGISEWLSDRVNGRLVPPSAGAEGLAAALAEVLRDERVWSALSDGARAVASRFSVDAHLASLEGVLRQAAASTPAHA